MVPIGRLDLMGYAGAAASLYGYMSLNFMNFGKVPVVGSLDATFGWNYLHTFNLLVPYESCNHGGSKAAPSLINEEPIASSVG